MTYQFDVNNIFPNDNNICNSYALFKFKTLLKSVGWTVLKSSDGTTYNSSGDQITQYTSGSNGLNNNYAWFILQQPVGGRQLCFQRGTGDSGWRVKYSYSAGFTGGSPSSTVTPSATDEQIMNGAGSDASPTFATTFVTNNANSVLHIMADNAAPYGFYLTTVSIPVSGTPTLSYQTLFAMDPLLDGTYDALDTDPYAFIIYKYNETITAFNLSSGSSGSSVFKVLGYIGKGTDNEQFSYLGLKTFTLAANGESYVGMEPLTLKMVLKPALYERQTSSTYNHGYFGYKGISSLFKYTSLNLMSSTCITLDTEADHICIGPLILPWNGSAPYI